MLFWLILHFLTTQYAIKRMSFSECVGHFCQSLFACYNVLLLLHVRDNLFFLGYSDFLGCTCCCKDAPLSPFLSSDFSSYLAVVVPIVHYVISKYVNCIIKMVFSFVINKKFEFKSVSNCHTSSSEEEHQVMTAKQRTSWNSGAAELNPSPPQGSATLTNEQMSISQN